jgi:phosphoserine aminotransferase
VSAFTLSPPFSSRGASSPPIPAHSLSQIHTLSLTHTAGGLAAQQKLNEQKAKLLYDAIDGSNGFYNNPVAPAARSLMNVPFTIPSNADLEKAFIKEAEKKNMVREGGQGSGGWEEGDGTNEWGGRRGGS